MKQLLLAMTGNQRARKIISSKAVTRRVVDRFVAGETEDGALRATARLTSMGLATTLDYLGEDCLDREQASATTAAYTSLLGRLGRAGDATNAEVSVKLSAIGQALPLDGEKVAVKNALRICSAAREAGTTVTLDMEDHTTTDSTLGILRELRREFPDVGVALQAYLHRTEQDCRDLAHLGSRIRLCKGAYDEPVSVAYRGKTAVNEAYIRCLSILIKGDGYPMIASHDPSMIAAAKELTNAHGRIPGDFEFQMLYGIRTDEQRALAESGNRMRIYIPYGDEWYGYFMRRLAERPANVGFFLRALVSKH